MGVKAPTSKQAEILTALEPFGYKLETVINPKTLEHNTYVRQFHNYYSIEEAVDRYYNVYSLHLGV